MRKQDVIEFFDRLAPGWDADMIRHDDILSTILTLGGIREGIDVLDVACGTGVMFDYYLQRNVSSVTGIDISSEMAKIAENKFIDEPRVQVICGDVEEEPYWVLMHSTFAVNNLPMTSEGLDSFYIVRLT